MGAAAATALTPIPPDPGGAHAPNRTISGTSNNLDHPYWGSEGEQLLRIAAAEYADGLSQPAGGYRPNPRVVSNRICAQADPENPILDPRNLSDYIWAWGQLLDHELDLTEPVAPPEVANFQTPADDRFPNRTVPFRRSIYHLETGKINPRQQINQVTAFIDASNVYGSTDERASALRTHVAGRLKTGPGPDGPLLPKNSLNLPNAGGSRSDAYLAGDIRANEHVVLTSMHVLFLREHNRRAAILAARHTDWDDERIYQRARKEVGAIMQAITYNEFLPALLGSGRVPAYAGYKPEVNAGISNEFSTAFYRVGHTMVAATLPTGRAQGQGIPLRQGFFRPDQVDLRGVEPFLDGLAFQKMQRVDPQVVDDLRSFLFGHVSGPDNELLDLAALNIQRGRDHGIAHYNACREAYGLPRKTCFADITDNTHTQHALAELYDNVDNIDAWVGALCESHLEAASVGELTCASLLDQFCRSRDGDWFWYENDPAFSADDCHQISQTTLSHVIQRNTGLTDLPDNVFVVPES